MKNTLVHFSVLVLAIVAGNDANAHSLPLNKVAVDACQEKKKSHACQYSGHHNDLYIGTCQLITEEKLICVRNKPIQILERKSDGAETKSKANNSDRITNKCSRHSKLCG